MLIDGQAAGEGPNDWRRCDARVEVSARMPARNQRDYSRALLAIGLVVIGIGISFVVVSEFRGLETIGRFLIVFGVFPVGLGIWVRRFNQDITAPYLRIDGEGITLKRDNVAVPWASIVGLARARDMLYVELSTGGVLRVPIGDYQVVDQIIAVLTDQARAHKVPFSQGDGSDGGRA